MTDVIDKNIIVFEILIPALKRLYLVDFDNIKIGVSERNICARLSIHMENIMREFDLKNMFSNYFVDVEYNRMKNSDLIKSVDGKGYIVSDLLIHERGNKNLLAIEMKRSGYNRNVESDKERLKKMVSSLNGFSIECVRDTLVGAFVKYSPEDVEIEIYENVGGKGMHTRNITIEYLNQQRFQITYNMVFEMN